MNGSPAFLLILVLFAVSGKCQSQEVYHPQYRCPPNFIRLGNSCYYFSTDMKSWHDAHFACRGLQSQLAALETRWEDRTLRNYMNKPQFASLNRWVGGIYNWSRRQWTWGSSASVMTYSGFLTPQFPRSSRWHCLFLSPVLNYRWNHDLCTQTMHYLCEAPLIRIPDPNEIVVAVNTNL
ncbi:perlucin-like protein [Penaeus japonicus]|uniref:perlucin-like protein n=1 Tax=Penaeus japonicus TaxID=27405 RepID=UPI001C714769|nr:perlucin-like protein [Penaeus japonicus]XP_042888268.1 perlucin-like protein [Penaeus japonicus]